MTESKYDKLDRLAQQDFEKKLKFLVNSGADCIDVAQKKIDDFGAPFIITKTEVETDGKKETKWILQSALSNGMLWLNKFITYDEETLAMKADAERAMDTPYEVLVYGDTGTGKELIAKSQIGRRKGDIKAVNCAGFPRDLIESELFGHVAGSFTGAKNTQQGLISLANNGVLFMDEIGELPMDMQSKLLRVIQEKKLRKVGGKEDEEVTCKFVFASNKDLFKMAREGQFRIDLLARISTLFLRINNLRDRPCDIKPIALSLRFGDRFWERYGSDIETEVLELPFNVRSLQQYIIQYEVFGRVIKMGK